MKAAFLLCFALLVSQAHAADQAAWNAIAKKLVAPGTYDPETGYHFLSNVNPNDRSCDRQADYLGTNSVGVGEDGNYVATYIQANSETWKRQGSTWDIDQWYHRVDAKGALISAQHYHMVQDDHRGVIVYDNLPTGGLESAEVLGAWEAAQLRWIATLSK